MHYRVEVWDRSVRVHERACYSTPQGVITHIAGLGAARTAKVYVYTRIAQYPRCGQGVMADEAAIRLASAH